MLGLVVMLADNNARRAQQLSLERVAELIDARHSSVEIFNQFIVAALARAVSGEAPESGPVVVSQRERSLRVALIVNAIVVAIAAATAIALLIYAFR